MIYRTNIIVTNSFCNYLLSNSIAQVNIEKYNNLNSIEWFKWKFVILYFFKNWEYRYSRI